MESFMPIEQIFQAQNRTLSTASASRTFQTQPQRDQSREQWKEVGSSSNSALKRPLNGQENANKKLKIKHLSSHNSTSQDHEERKNEFNQITMSVTPELTKLSWQHAPSRKEMSQGKHAKRRKLVDENTEVQIKDPLRTSTISKCSSMMYALSTGNQKRYHEPKYGIKHVHKKSKQSRKHYSAASATNGTQNKDMTVTDGIIIKKQQILSHSTISSLSSESLATKQRKPPKKKEKHKKQSGNINDNASGQTGSLNPISANKIFKQSQRRSAMKNRNADLQSHHIRSIKHFAKDKGNKARSPKDKSSSVTHGANAMVGLLFQVQREVARQYAVLPADREARKRRHDKKIFSTQPPKKQVTTTPSPRRLISDDRSSVVKIPSSTFSAKPQYSKLSTDKPLKPRNHTDFEASHDGIISGTNVHTGYSQKQQAFDSATGISDHVTHVARTLTNISSVKTEKQYPTTKQVKIQPGHRHDKGFTADVLEVKVPSTFSSSPTIEQSRSFKKGFEENENEAIYRLTEFSVVEKAPNVNLEVVHPCGKVSIQEKNMYRKRNSPSTSSAREETREHHCDNTSEVSEWDENSGKISDVFTGVRNEKLRTSDEMAQCSKENHSMQTQSMCELPKVPKARVYSYIKSIAQKLKIPIGDVDEMNKLKSGIPVSDESGYQNDADIGKMATAAAEVSQSTNCRFNSSDIDTMKMDDMYARSQESMRYSTGNSGTVTVVRNLKESNLKPPREQRRNQSSSQNNLAQRDVERISRPFKEHQKSGKELKQNNHDNRGDDISNTSNRSVIASESVCPYNNTSQNVHLVNQKSMGKPSARQEQKVYKCSECFQEFNSISRMYSSQHPCRLQCQYLDVGFKSAERLSASTLSADIQQSNNDYKMKSNHSKPDGSNKKRRLSLPSDVMRFTKLKKQQQDDYRKGKVIPLGSQNSKQYPTHKQLTTRKKQHEYEKVDLVSLPLPAEAHFNEKTDKIQNGNDKSSPTQRLVADTQMPLEFNLPPYSDQSITAGEEKQSGKGIGTTAFNEIQQSSVEESKLQEINQTGASNLTCQDESDLKSCFIAHVSPYPHPHPKKDNTAIPTEKTHAFGSHSTNLPEPRMSTFGNNLRVSIPTMESSTLINVAAERRQQNLLTVISKPQNGGSSTAPNFIVESTGTLTVYNPSHVNNTRPVVSHPKTSTRNIYCTIPHSTNQQQRSVGDSRQGQQSIGQCSQIGVDPTNINMHTNSNKSDQRHPSSVAGLYLPCLQNTALQQRLRQHQQHQQQRYLLQQQLQQRQAQMQQTQQQTQAQHTQQLKQHQVVQPYQLWEKRAQRPEVKQQQQIQQPRFLLRLVPKYVQHLYGHKQPLELVQMQHPWHQQALNQQVDTDGQQRSKVQQYQLQGENQASEKKQQQQMQQQVQSKQHLENKQVQQQQLPKLQQQSNLVSLLQAQRHPPSQLYERQQSQRQQLLQHQIKQQLHQERSQNQAYRHGRYQLNQQQVQRHEIQEQQHWQLQSLQSTQLQQQQLQQVKHDQSQMQQALQLLARPLLTPRENDSGSKVLLSVMHGTANSLTQNYPTGLQKPQNGSIQQHAAVNSPSSRATVHIDNKQKERNVSTESRAMFQKYVRQIVTTPTPTEKVSPQSEERPTEICTGNSNFLQKTQTIAQSNMISTYNQPPQNKTHAVVETVPLGVSCEGSESWLLPTAEQYSGKSSSIQYEQHATINERHPIPVICSSDDDVDNSSTAETEHNPVNKTPVQVPATLDIKQSLLSNVPHNVKSPDQQQSSAESTVDQCNINLVVDPNRGKNAIHVLDTTWLPTTSDKVVLSEQVKLAAPASLLQHSTQLCAESTVNPCNATFPSDQHDNAGSPNEVGTCSSADPDAHAKVGNLQSASSASVSEHLDILSSHNGSKSFPDVSSAEKATPVRDNLGIYPVVLSDINLSKQAHLSKKRSEREMKGKQTEKETSLPDESLETIRVKQAHRHAMKTVQHKAQGNSKGDFVLEQQESQSAVESTDIKETPLTQYGRKTRIPQVTSDDGKIPQPEQEPPLQNLYVTEDMKIIVFDLETSGSGAHTEITQIGATSCNGAATYDRYVLPSGSIFPKVTELTGIEVVSIGSQRYLKHNGRRVETLSIRDALLEFMDWIGSQKDTTSTTERPILCAHNARAFDMRVIIREVQQCGLQKKFENTVAGFMDSLPAFKSFHPDLKSYSQNSLYQYFVKGTFISHNAMQDAAALLRLIQEAKIPFETLSNHVYTTESAMENVAFHVRTQFRLSTLKPYLCGIVSKDMLIKIAASGLDYNHLRLVFDRDGPDGIRNLLKEEFKGRPRVTKLKHILKSVVNHFLHV